jgi:DNA-binding response OmpR family regulator
MRKNKDMIMQKTTKILIIEDDFMIREVIFTMLECEDFQVIEAEEGTEGIELATEYLPDLILCDIMMPHLSGYDVLKELAKQEKTATIPFIFISAKSQKNDVRMGMELGADDYITKPFTRDELVSAVKSRLKKQASRQNYYEHRIDELETQLKKLEKKLDQLIHANSGEIIAPTQGWQGRFEQVIMTNEKITNLTEEIKRGLEREEFQIYYQPQVNLNTQDIVGGEALLRWQHPERGMVSPAEFIPVAEAQGLIVPIGEWVIKTVCQQMKKWQDMGVSFKTNFGEYFRPAGAKLRVCRKFTANFDGYRIKP